VTFLFTDIEGSTRLWDQRPREMRAALARHDRILRDAIAAHGGFVFSHGGDGVAAAFQRAGDALLAAIEAGRGLLVGPWPIGLELRVRMGVHTGEADEREGDYFGPPLNQAARLMSAARGGQILVSATTAGMLWSVTGIEWVDVGLVELRGIGDPMHAFGVIAEGVPWVEREPKSVETMAGNVPTPVDEWFGSIAELRRRVVDLSRRRLVTLTGAGGVGKTRLALEMATMAADEFVDGVWLVELAPMTEPSSVALAVATILSIQPLRGMTVVEAIADGLRGRRLLLVLDNSEHVLGAVAELAAAIVSRCPTVTVLATSREPLGVAGERVLPLMGLAASDAVGLFRDRMAAVDDTVRLSADDERAVVAICEQVDGLPLAIELAAARLRSLTPTEVLDRLGDRLRLLRSSSRRGLERHRTLEATVDWSYQLLTADERCLFDRLSVFAGGFDLAAVEAICVAPPLERADVFELLASLVDKSMVVADRGVDGTRYRLLETLRQFAAERVAAAGIGDELRERHLGHYVEVVQMASRLWVSPGQLAADVIFDREWDNVRAAQMWALATANVHAADLVVDATGPHAQARSRPEHGGWAERTVKLEAAGVNPVSSSFYWASRGAGRAADNEASMRLAERGIHAAPWPEHPDAVPCWGALIGAHLAAGRSDAAAEAAPHLARIDPDLLAPFARWEAVHQLLENALANDRGSVGSLLARLTDEARQIGAPALASETARYRALSALYAEDPRDPGRAYAAAAEGVELARTGGDSNSECLNRAALAMAAVAHRRPDAGEICRHALTRNYDVRNWLGLWLLIETTASYLAASASLHEAAVLYGHLEAHHAPWGLPAVYRARQRGLDRVRQLDDFEVLMAQGADMDRDELVIYTIDRLGQAVPTSSKPE
jgi:predicted ATPase/class 3 adenylate cyclase